MLLDPSWYCQYGLLVTVHTNGYISAAERHASSACPAKTADVGVELCRPSKCASVGGMEIS